jgi:hypothetical protein
MSERIHSDLGYLTPAEFEAAFHSRAALLSLSLILLSRFWGAVHISA